MKRRLISILTGLIFLVAALFVGTPFEFLDNTLDTVATFAIMILIVVLFIALYREMRTLENKIVKWTALGLWTLIAITYLLVGIWTTLLTWSSYHPMWQDLTIYTNSKDQKVISQWRRTSGSIYDYRDRRIIADFGQLRISFDCNAKNLNGIWTEHNIEENSTTTINFDNNK